MGKSTFFNRVIGRRQALVNDMIGVTRDRHYADADWRGREFVLVDTGGIAEGESKSIQASIKKQTLSAISEADAIIVLFDGREGATRLDEHVVELVRKSKKPVLYVVNKADKLTSGNADEYLAHFYELGIPSKSKLFAVSSEHGRGVDEVLDEVINILATSPLPSSVAGGDIEESVPRVAIIGRPNAGKSTLVNRLAGVERVIAHEMPGTTRDTIDVEIKTDGKEYIFIDTAGLKRKGRTIEALDKFSAIKTLDAISRADVVLLVVDANEGFTHQDSSLLDHAYSEGKAVIVLFNKWDVLTHDPKELSDFYSEKLVKLHRVPFLCISAKTGLGVKEIFAELERVAQAFAARLSTSELNKALENIKTEHNIPSYKGKAVKIYYATQVAARPPAFVIFSNHPEGIGEGYKRFLINKFQDIIGNGVPIKIKFKKK